jgi:hypothetical protein
MPWDKCWARHSLPAFLDLSNSVAKDWVGLIAYRLTGRTDALFPEPNRGICTIYKDELLSTREEGSRGISAFWRRISSHLACHRYGN